MGMNPDDIFNLIGYLDNNMNKIYILKQIINICTVTLKIIRV